MIRDNYFILLGLDPEKDADNQGIIQAALAAKQKEWSQGRNHPTKGKQFQRYLNQHPKINELMADDAARRQEAADAIKIVKQRRAEVLQDFDEQAQLAAAKGYLTDADIAALATRFKASLSDANIRARVKKLGLSVQKGQTKPSASRPRLDPSVANRIAANLKLIGKDNLYNFLDRPRSATAKALLNRAEEVYAEVRKVAQKDAVIGARQELAGDCMKVFASEKDREKYDNALASAELDRIRLLAEAAGAGEGRIPPGAMAQLIEAGKKQDLSRDEVIDAVREVVKKHPGWYVEVPPQASDPEQQLCGACGELAAPNIANCPNCGTPFNSPCPRCGTVNSSTSRFCSRQGCGFAVGDMPLAERACRDARLAFSRGDSAEAMRLLNLSLIYWPGHAEATRLTAELQKRTEAVEKVLAAIGARRFREARSLFASSRELVSDDPRAGPLERQIADALQEAQRRLDHGNNLQQRGEGNEAIEAYHQALAICQDFEEARIALQNCPPSAPSCLQARATPEKILLSWQASLSRRTVVYHLLCRHQADGPGRYLGQTSDTHWTDAAVTPGSLCWYELTAVSQEGVRSATVSVGPILAVGEVIGLKAEASDRQVVLTWQSPPKVRRTEIYRADGRIPPPPSGPGCAATGCTLLPLSTINLRDTGLLNETIYGYRVCCVFVDFYGKEVITPGIGVTATPCMPPLLVTSLSADAGEEGMVLSWCNPHRVEVTVVRTEQLPALEPGQTLTRNEVDRLGTCLSRVMAIRAIDPAPRAHQPWYLVFSANRFLASYCGQLQYVELEDLHVQQVEHGVLLTWKWPPGCAALLVSHAGSPLNDDGKPFARTANAETGELFVKLSELPPGEQTFQARCVLYEGDSTRAAGQGRQVTTRIVPPRIIRWRWRRRGVFRKTVEVVVETQADLSDLQCLRLVGKVNEVPRSLHDGRCLGEWRPNHDSEVRLEIRSWPEARGEVFCRLFCEPADALTIMQLPVSQAVL